MVRNVTCNKCGRVYVTVSLAQINFDKKYYGGCSVKEYMRCGCGNMYHNFREFKEGDCPSGVTISTILDPCELFGLSEGETSGQ